MLFQRFSSKGTCLVTSRELYDIPVCSAHQCFTGLGLGKGRLTLAVAQLKQF